MNYKDYRYLIQADLYRIASNISFSKLILNLLFGESFKYIFWMRTCRYLKEIKWLKYSFYLIALIMLNHYKYKFGIGIPATVEIGPGFYIGHFGCIFVYPLCKIGKNCNLSQGVTLGKANRGKNKGYPVIGDNVYVGPGAKIVGSVHIGNNVAIGANCVVTKDVPDNAVVVGVPGTVISYAGSNDYITNIDYDKKIEL
jgi:serine O-acetyltransferase